MEQRRKDLKREASDDIRGGAGDDIIDALGVDDWVYGQAGSDQLSGGDDLNLIMFLVVMIMTSLWTYRGCSVWWNHDDLLLNLGGSGFHDAGLGHDVVLAGDLFDVVFGDLGLQMLLTWRGMTSSLVEMARMKLPVVVTTQSLVMVQGDLLMVMSSETFSLAMVRLLRSMLSC